MLRRPRAHTRGAVQVDFYYDIVCPYAYIASTQIERVAKEHGATVSWHPILLGGLLRKLGAPVDPNAAMPPSKSAWVRADLERTAQLCSVPFHRPDAHPRRTVEAMRLAAIASPERRPEVSNRLFEAYWKDDVDVADPEVLDAIASSSGIPPERRVTQAARDALYQSTSQAKEVGVFGVPSFRIGETLVWGQDRMWQIRQALAGHPVDPSVAEGRLPCPARVTGVRFFHDFASPFSYLGSTQIERVAKRHGVPVQWHPILLGALFRAIGTPDVPMFAMSQPKQAWVRRDMLDWARAWGVDFSFPEHFPIRSVLPLRVALVDPRTTACIYRAAWAEGRRIDESESLAAVLDAAGFDGRRIIEAAGRVEVKQELRTRTASAEAYGVCGVPTMRVEFADGSGTLLWGQDRLDQLDAILSAAGRSG